jgi:hypothetical protein
VAGSRSQSKNRKSRNSSRARALARQQKIDMDSLQMKLELNAKMKSHLLSLLEDLAEEVSLRTCLARSDFDSGMHDSQGDVQTSTILAYVLRQKIDIEPQFLARITSAYLSRRS